MGRGKNRKRRARRFQMKNGELVETTKQEERVTHPKSVEKNVLNFRLEIPDTIFQKVMWWVNKANHEVSGFGSLEFDEKDNLYRVTDVILLKQEVGPTSSEIDPGSLGKAMFRMKDQPGALKWHWHSHVDMGVFWSGDDRELIRSLGQQGWIMATVFNKKQEMKTAFQTTAQIMGKTHDIFQDDIPTFTQRYLPSDFVKALDKEYEENVKASTPPVHQFPHQSGWVEREYDLLPHHNGKVWKDGKWVDEEPVTDSYNKFRDVIMAPEYDREGWVKHGGKWRYNPCYDRFLVSREEKMGGIDEMDAEEIEYMKARSPSFEMLLRDYVIKKAQEPAPTVDEPAETLFIEA